ncbi:hypothetical protein SS50377_22188 [Spironucleus salmonicida]|uniref:Uncharacterized protein n=1 Tax=Spironucleus salmonicida TaxID=348837 RepID=V6LPK0_9EUKA|nr:hypothetical protein SS50377_22188 [Spironucleus salmonicida]|eukprot:EST45651.1 Hypothetical protein SS50377_14223 [Spironucleus salmonicida]
MKKTAGMYTLTMNPNPQSFHKKQYFLPIITIVPRCDALSYFDQSNTFNQQVFLQSTDDVNQFFNIVHSMVLPISNYRPQNFSAFVNFISIPDYTRCQNMSDPQILSIIKDNKQIQPFFEQMQVVNETTANAKICQNFINKKLLEFSCYIKDIENQAISLVPMISVEEAKLNIENYTIYLQNELQSIDLSQFYSQKYNIELIKLAANTILK